ncbi:HET-domain-containing protein [Corynespora cassiicola Philippines]|uniref:HET-domain-containing protein n=1 Tax=Corynespora cassiicola Philippines TaxID=1448308 RepID=A0A2T2NDN2_CORCC|nr:HET-domain-containing protein [Corynespora cassiicola Philippines]
MFCEVCHELFCRIQSNPQGEVLGKKDVYHHHDTLSALEKLCAKDCELCVRLLSHYNTLRITKPCPVFITCTWSFADKKGTVTFLLGFNGRHEYSHLNILFVKVHPQLDWEQIWGYAESLSTASPSTLQMARNWIEVCRREHTECKFERNIETASWKPTRLIFLDEPVRLIEKDDIPDNVQYMTLSHRWGRIENKCVLQTENLDIFKREIPLPARLKTFNDTFHIVRQLGVLYVWIDSCIIQNSKSDWEFEAGQMSNMYRYSYCNIFATSAVDDTGGCFFQRELKGALLPRVILDKLSDKTSTGIYELFVTNQTSKLHRMWANNVDNSPVNCRGWVFQERALSPRGIHFTTNGLHWECSKSQAIDYMPSFPLYLGAGKPIIEGFVCRESPNAISEPYVIREWRWIICQYTQPGRFLSTVSGPKENPAVPTDKLAAIAGIARVVQPCFGCRYYAGIWEKDILNQLGWFIYKPEVIQADIEPSRYRAPSWSWASSRSEICWPFLCDPQYIPLVDVFDIKVQLSGEDEFGQITDGYLRLSGNLFSVQLPQGNSQKRQQSLLVHKPAKWTFMQMIHVL